MNSLIKTCPTCGATMTVKPGKYGKFWACSEYPKCKQKAIKYIFEKQEIILKASNVYTNTNEQDLIINCVKNTLKNILVKANPGCGKTSTLESIYNYLNQKGFNVMAFAFGNLAVDSMKERGIDASTLNKLSLKDSRFVFPKSRINVKKIDELILSCGLIPEDSRKTAVDIYKRVISLLDANMLNIDTESLKQLNDLYENLGIDSDEQTILILKDIETRRIASRDRELDFDDTMRIAVNNSEKCLKVDYALFDECQDFTKLNLAFIKVSINKNSRLFFVGDPNQSVYAFRGADIDSIDNIIKDFQPEIFELTQTFRIPQNIVNGLLNIEFPNIKLSSHKIGGEVLRIKESALTNAIQKDDTAYIISPHNAPMIKPAYELIRKGFNVCVKGKEIGQDLISLVVKIKSKYKAGDLKELNNKLESHVNSQFDKYKNARNKNFLHKLADESDTIKEISSESESIEDLLNKIDKLFSNTDATYTFMTGHKSKGLEHKNTYIYKLNLIGSNNDEPTAKELKQQNNLKWVMLTRSLNKIVITEE